MFDFSLYFMYMYILFVSNTSR